jgi:hypothetical protein
VLPILDVPALTRHPGPHQCHSYKLSFDQK